MTVAIAHGMAHGLKKIERDVGHIAWGSFKKNDSLGTTILVDIEGGKDLVPVTIWDGHKLSFDEFYAKVDEVVQRAKAKKDKAHKEMREESKALYDDIEV